jgi:hypothetical protein
LIQNLPTIIAKIVSAVPQIISALVSGFGGAVSSIAEVGGHIVEGLWDGIKQMGDCIKNKVSDFVGGIVDGVKGVLGIHSPSRIFKGIGVNMAAGLGEGFGDAMTQVSRDIQAAVPTDFDIETNANVHGTVSGNLASSSANLGQSNFGFAGVTVQNLYVRTEEDVRRISQNFYDLMQTGARAQGRFKPA